MVSLKKESYQVIVVKRFHVQFKTDENTTLNIVKNKPWLAQKIQQCSGRYFYPSTHENLTTVKAAVTGNYVM